MRLCIERPHSDDQPDDADEHVGAVDAGEDEEARAEQVGVDVEALTGELGELEDLAADERRRRRARWP